jgi:hypothetical protein
MTEPAAVALLRDAEAYLSALHVHVARHDNIGADGVCGGCLLRDRIAAALPQLAAVPSADQTTDRAALRDRIADTVTPFLANFSDEETARINAGEVTVAVLAVLPEPADQAAVLLEAAEAVQSSDVEYNTEAAEAALKNGGPFALIAYVQLAIGEHLRRLAAEAPTTTQPDTDRPMHP